MKKYTIPKSKNRLKQMWRKMMSRCYNPKNKDYYKKIAKDFYKDREMFFIGRNIDYALCMEASLKMKEIS